MSGNYRPLFVIDQYGVMQYVDAPLLAVAPDREPSAALKLAVEPGFDLIFQLGIRIGTGCGEPPLGDRLIREMALSLRSSMAGNRLQFHFSATSDRLP